MPTAAQVGAAPTDHTHDYLTADYSAGAYISLTGHPSVGDQDVF